MRIDRIDLYHVAMPLISPWRTAYGEDSVIESVLVKLSCGEIAGWGEASALAAPTYSPEYAAGVFHLLTTWLAPKLVGTDIQHPAEISELFSWVKGNPFAKAGIDMGWWDLHARINGQPLYRMLGGNDPRVAVGADFGIGDSIETLLHDIQGAVKAGFPRVKLKFRPGWDVPMVRAVRKEFPGLVMHVDCNSGYALDDSAIFEALDEFDLAMIEQPLAHDDLIDHAKLQRRIKTPICLDESITSPERARQAIEIGACRVINIKPPRVGGLTNARHIHELCRRASVPCWVGGMLESALGAAHCIALATLPGFTYPADIFPSSRFYRDDLSKPETQLTGAAEVRASDAPGTGAAPDRSRLTSCIVSQASFVA